MNEDYRDILQALVAEHARFLIVGAHALALHGYPRSTVDIDIWIDATEDIDILTAVSGLTFERAWANRVDDVIEGVRVPVLGLADLIANKTAAGRDKDRADVKGVKGKN